MNYELTCADCAHTFDTRYKQTRYCRICRLVRNLTWLTSRSVKCWSCEISFAPLSRNERFCTSCDTSPKSGVTGVCELCKRKDITLHHQDIAVCNHCMRDKTQRKTLLRALQRKQAERQGTQVPGANADTKRTAPTGPEDS